MTTLDKIHAEARKRFWRAHDAARATRIPARLATYRRNLRRVSRLLFGNAEMIAGVESLKM
jgi:hypothetical protein